MPKYIIAYHGGKMPESPEEGAKQKAKWQKWINDLGDSVVNPGSPMGRTKIVSLKGVSDDDGSDTMSGFSVVKTDNLNSALEMAKSCPYLEIGGKLKVAELMEM